MMLTLIVRDMVMVAARPLVLLSNYLRGKYLHSNLNDLGAFAWSSLVGHGACHGYTDGGCLVESRSHRTLSQWWCLFNGGKHFSIFLVLLTKGVFSTVNKAMSRTCARFIQEPNRTMVDRPSSAVAACLRRLLDSVRVLGRWAQAPLSSIILKFASSTSNHINFFSAPVQNYQGSKYILYNFLKSVHITFGNCYSIHPKPNDQTFGNFFRK